MRISDWSSDVCSSDLQHRLLTEVGHRLLALVEDADAPIELLGEIVVRRRGAGILLHRGARLANALGQLALADREALDAGDDRGAIPVDDFQRARSEEHTSELQSLMRISYAVFCLKKK